MVHTQKNYLNQYRQVSTQHTFKDVLSTRQVNKNLSHTQFQQVLRKLQEEQASQVLEVHVILRIFIWRRPRGIQILQMVNRQKVDLIAAQQIVAQQVVVIVTVNKHPT
jgi:hypothetical protein